MVDYLFTGLFLMSRINIDEVFKMLRQVRGLDTSLAAVFGLLGN